MYSLENTFNSSFLTSLLIQFARKWKHFFCYVSINSYFLHPETVNEGNSFPKQDVFTNDPQYEKDLSFCFAYDHAYDAVGR